MRTINDARDKRERRGSSHSYLLYRMFLRVFSSCLYPLLNYPLYLFLISSNSPASANDLKIGLNKKKKSRSQT